MKNKNLNINKNFRCKTFLEFVKTYSNRDHLKNILYSNVAINATVLELAQLLDLTFNGIRIITNKIFKKSTILTFDIKFYFVTEDLDSVKRSRKPLHFRFEIALMNLLKKHKDRNFDDIFKSLTCWDPDFIKGSTVLEIVSTDVYINGRKTNFSQHSPFTPLIDHKSSKPQYLILREFPDPITGDMIDAYFRLNGMSKPFIEARGKSYMKVDQ